MRHMAKALEQLPLSYQENSGQKMRLQGLKKRYQELTDKLTVFLNSGNSICWMEKRESLRRSFMTLLPCVRFQWNWNRFYSVTSGADRYRLLLRPAQCQSGVILGTLRE